MNVYIQPDTGGISAAFGKLQKAMENSPAIRDGFTHASALYLGFTRRRFVEQSQGGGEWPDLALSTKVARLRKTKAGRRKYDKIKAKVKRGPRVAIRARTVGTMQLGGLHFAILRDTSTLLNSLSTGAPGSIVEDLPDGVRVGTAIQYAKYHQEGGGRLPQRKILVSPDGPTSQRIQQVLSAAVVKALNEVK